MRIYQKENLLFFALILPAFLLILLFVILPAIWAVGISFTNQSLLGPQATEFDFVGFDNYLRLFGDDSFWNSIRVSVVFVLISWAPHNIYYLNLPLTLSQEYGVSDRISAHVLSSFFIKLILDAGTPREVADEIFALTIKQGLSNRDRRLVTKLIRQMCHQKLHEGNWVTEESKFKFRLLEQQLIGFSQGLDPIVADASVLLRNFNSVNRNRIELLGD